MHSARARSHRQMSPARPPPARCPEAATPQAGASATQLTAAEWLESHLRRWQTKRYVSCGMGGRAAQVAEADTFEAHSQVLGSGVRVKAAAILPVPIPAGVA